MTRLLIVITASTLGWAGSALLLELHVKRVSGVRWLPQSEPHVPSEAGRISHELSAPDMANEMWHLINEMWHLIKDSVNLLQASVDAQVDRRGT